jgi:UDP-N-acetyl-D-mannosaminuronate dehydrogenase
MDTEQQNNLVYVVKQWVTIDNQIRALNSKVRELRNAKKEQNQKMIDVMKANEIDNFDLKDGQIQYKKSSKKEALTQKTLLKILSQHPQLDEEQATNLNQFIYDSRTVSEKESIVRKIVREPTVP